MIWCNKGYAGYNYAVARELPYSLLTTEENPLIIEQDGITYYITNGKALAIGCDTSVVTATVPATVNGYPVTLLRQTFLGCTNLTSVTLPEGLQRVGRNAFEGCEKLTSITIPSTVNRIGEDAFSGCISLKSLTLPKNLVEIDRYAFHGCTGLTSMVLPDSVTKLDPGIFSHCSNLTSITLSKNITEIPYNFFQYCTNLKKVTIPEKVTYIDDEVFLGCTSLTSVDFPDSVAYIEGSVFKNCTSLTRASFIQNATTIESQTFLGCTSLKEVVIPDTVQTIDAQAFYNCSALSNVTIPEGVTTINKQAFDGCTSLYVVSVPKTVTDIKAKAFPEDTALIVEPDSAALNYAVENGLLYAIKGVDPEPTVVTQDQITYLVMEDEAIAVDCTATATSVTIPSAINGKPVTKLQRTFKNCTSLVSVSLPETLTTIGIEAFYGCTSLTGITIPDSVTSIGSYAFYRCTKLASAQLPANLEMINEGAFNNSSIQSVVIPANTVTLGRSAFYSCTALSTVTFASESKLETIGGSAFCYCTSLKSISIPSTVTSLGGSAFSYCKVLTRVTLPDGLTSIESSTFSDCTCLTSITLPDTITSIGTFAFESCTSLASINIPTAVQSIGYTAFYDTAITSITIPEGITTVKQHTFAGCNKLESVYLPDSLTTIEETAFDGCSSLEKIVLPQGIKSIASNSFTSKTLLIVHENSYAHSFAEENQCLYTLYGDTEPTFCTVDSIRYCLIDGGYIAVGCTNSSITSATIPATINGEPVIKMYGTFDGCTYLSSVSLPESIVEIGGHTFYNCQYLKNISIPESVKTIGKWAFWNCKSLTSIDLPEKMDMIGESAFQQSNLTSITLPSELNTLGKQAFYHCEKLQKITIPQGVKVIEEGTFIYCRALQSVQLPETIESIGSDAFDTCDKLTTINFPESLTQIGSGAFSNCSSLTSAIIPNVTVVGGGAFSDCSALVETDLRSVETLGGSAFSSCVSLTEIRLPNIKTVGLAAFAYCSNLNSIAFGDSLETLSYRVFDECYSLMTVRIPKKTEIANQNAFTRSMVLLVYENSPAHLALKSTAIYLFILRDDNNPETAYGTGITGTANYTDGTVAAGATAEIFYDDGTLKEKVIVAADGSYNFTYAEVGRYTIRVTDAAGSSASTQVSVKRMNVFDVFLEGDTALTLKKGWSVSGMTNENTTLTVTDQDGNSIATTTTLDGSFTFTDIPNGTYVIKAESENGSVAQEFTVFNADVTDLTLTVVAEAVTLWGYVEVEDREFNHHRRNWVNVTVYNEDGIAVGQTKSDPDGKYTFENLPVGTYTIVAETTEMRPEKKKKYDRVFTLTGYAYVEAAEVGTYEVETIVLYEENDALATISGKVTAQGETQDCEVVLRDVFRHEVAQYTTGKNGKYSFKNIKDGLYFITATTNSDGMGMAVVVVRDGKVYGETDITVRKNDKVLRQYEAFNQDVPDCQSREEALQHKDRIAEEKRLYDALSEKEKKQMPKDYAERLNRYAEWITQVDYTAEDGATVEGGGLVVSGEELEQNDSITFNLSVEKVAAGEVGEEGVHTREDFIHQSIRDTAKDHEIKQYYEISMTKTVDGEEKAITSVQKDTDSTGKFRITLPIPEEHRGYKHYSVIHVHHGKPVTLTDLDDDPNTVTFEVDQFSTFVLSASNTALTCETGAHTFEGETTVVPSTCTEAGTETGYCSVCEQAVVIELPLADHSYVDGICSVCGQTENLNPNQWIYEAKGAYSVTLTFAEEIALTDTLCIYDANDVELGRYTAQELAGKSLTFLKESVKILRLTDETDTDFGFISADALMADTSGALRLLRKIDKVDTTLTDEAADINGDGKVTVYDAVRFLQLLNNTPVA